MRVLLAFGLPGRIFLLAHVPTLLVLAVQDSLIGGIKRQYGDFKPNAIVDVGANRGLWSMAARKMFPEAKMLLLEASPQHDERLKQVTGQLSNAEHRIAVLADTSGETVLFHQDGDTGNSMFKENTHFYANSKPVERITSTLDAEIENSFLRMEQIDIIKVDVQGAEMLVFRGATKALAQATFVQFEGSIVQYNKGAACFYDVDEFLRSQGFFLYDFGDLRRNPELFRTKGIGQFDVLYVKPSSLRLPRFLKDSNATFCGQNDNHKFPKVSSSSSSATPNVTSDIMDKDLAYLEDSLRQSIPKRWSQRRSAVAYILGVLTGAAIMFFFAGIYVIPCRQKVRVH